MKGDNYSSVGLELVHLVQDRDQWRTLENMPIRSVCKQLIFVRYLFIGCLYLELLIPIKVSFYQVIKTSLYTCFLLIFSFFSVCEGSLDLSIFGFYDS
jgi:hypothetical protein